MCNHSEGAENGSCQTANDLIDDFCAAIALEGDTPSDDEEYFIAFYPAEPPEVGVCTEGNLDELLNVVGEGIDRDTKSTLSDVEFVSKTSRFGKALYEAAMWCARLGKAKSVIKGLPAAAEKPLREIFSSLPASKVDDYFEHLKLRSNDLDSIPDPEVREAVRKTVESLSADGQVFDPGIHADKVRSLWEYTRRKLNLDQSTIDAAEDVLGALRECSPTIVKKNRSVSEIIDSVSTRIKNKYGTLDDLPVEERILHPDGASYVPKPPVRDLDKVLQMDGPEKWALLPEGEHLPFIIDLNGDLWVSRGRTLAGHYDLSGGADVLGAGTFRMMRGPNGEPLIAALSSQTGTYKQSVKFLSSNLGTAVAKGAVPWEKMGFSISETLADRTVLP